MYHLFRSLYLHATSKEEYSILLLGLDNAGKTTFLNQVKNLYQISNDTSSAVGKDVEPAADPKAGNTVPTVGQNVAVINLPEMYVKIWDVGGQMTLRRLWTSYYKSCHAVIFVVDSSDMGTLERDDDDDDNNNNNNDKDEDDVSSLKSPVTPGVDDGGHAGGTIGRKWHGRRKSSYNVFAEDERDTVDDTPAKVQRVTSGTLNSHSGQGRLDECRAVLESVLGHPHTSGIPILVLANKQDREDCIEVVRIKEGFVRKVFEGDKGGLIRDSRVLPVSALHGTGVREAVDWIRKRVVGNKLTRAPVMR